MTTTTTSAPALGAQRSGAPSGWTARVRTWEYLLRAWRPYFVTGLLEAVGGPFLLVLALGVGLGSLVDARGTDAFGGASYLEFIGPALMCAAALQVTAGETSFNTYGRFAWNRVLWGTTATPVTPAQAGDAHVMFLATRLTLNALLFFGVYTAFGGGLSAASVLMVPVAVLTALSVGVWILTLSARLTGDPGGVFNVVIRFGVVPMTLFSATYFPITQLPPVLQGLAWVSPLWHGNELARAARLGGLGPGEAAVHLVVLLAVLTAGFVMMRRAFTVRLTR